MPEKRWVRVMRTPIGLLLGIPFLASCSSGDDEGQVTTTGVEMLQTANRLKSFSPWVMAAIAG